MHRTSGSLERSWFSVRRASRLLVLIGIGALLIATAARPAAAATLCVDSGGKGGCFASIGAAVAAAAPGDTINVAQGTYKEDVTITKPLSLIGKSAENTVIDATAKNNAVTITSTTDVVVSGFAMENANTAGLWITNSSFVTISDNRILDNDKALVRGATNSCPPLNGTPFQSGEALDCGEGVFLSAVDHSILAHNAVTGNSGGILITDDTGPTHDNLITGNSVVRNTDLDCGITLPSHSGAGVYHNTISGNDSSYNGGPGVGIFAPGPGSKAYGNVVINNRLRGNGNPGVTMHNHAVVSGKPLPIFSDNLIVGNDISANQKDTGDAATTGPTGINIFSHVPMTGMIISQNVITQEDLDIVLKAPAATGVALQVHLNNFPDNAVGIQNAGTEAIDATQNWWGCAGGPGIKGCASILGTGVLFTPWLTQPF